jgi:uncharacterized RDD family membrane protein YckC
MSYVGSPGGVQEYAGKGSGPRAGFGRRFAASLLDGIVIALASAILEALLKGTGYVLAILLGITYYTVLEGGPRGQTLGKQALSIRVISLEPGGGPIGYGRGFIRYIGRILSTIPLFLGYFWMLWDRESQCWHDKLARDVVVPISAYPLR